MSECAHENCTALALAFIDAGIARGDLKFGYDAIAAHLTERTGIPHTRGMVARILDDEAKRDSREKARALAAREAA